jgi:3-methyladenine DNA glycosylase AlkD
MVTVQEVLAELARRRDEKALAGMAKYGIRVDRAYGVSVPEIRSLGKRVVQELGRRDPARHAFAADLWRTGMHEAQVLASVVDLADMVTEEQMEAWASELDSWDTCDQLCNNLFGDTPFAWDKALEWSAREAEFVKRAGFALMAVLGWHGKGIADDQFLPFLAAIEREATDDRGYVKKAVNWALRNIGKRNSVLHEHAVESARRLTGSDDRTARWVGTDALRELESENIRRRLGLV